MMRRDAREERLAWLLLVTAMALSAALILWLNRGTTFWVDELTLFLQSSQFSLYDALQPHDGHLVFVPRLAYKAVFELFGTSYVPLRILTVAAVLLTVTLFFVYVKRRVGAVAALAPCLVLLFFGSDFLHVLIGNGFTIQLTISCGLGALLVLDRDRGRDRIIACALLCLGVFIYTIGLAFVVGVGLLILMRSDRWQRLWIVAIPVTLYGMWWIWSLSNTTMGPDSQIELINLLLVPAWGFQSLSAIFSALSGLDYQFGNLPAGVTPSGTVLAAVAIAATVWRLKSGSIPPLFWATVAVLATLWIFGALTASSARHPDSSRYLYPGAVVVLLVGAQAVAGRRWTRFALVTLYSFALAGLATNLVLLRDEGAKLRNGYAVQVRAAFGAVDLLGRQAKRNFEVPPIGADSLIPGGQSPLTFPFAVVAESGRSATDAYRDAAARYGTLGYSARQIAVLDEGVRAQVDSVLVSALGVELLAMKSLASSAQCKKTRSHSSQGVSVRLPPGGASLKTGVQGGSIGIRRFADQALFQLGELPPKSVAVLRIPVDAASRTWWASVPVDALTVCSLR